MCTSPIPQLELEQKQNRAMKTNSQQPASTLGHARHSAQAAPSLPACILHFAIAALTKPLLYRAFLLCTAKPNLFAVNISRPSSPSSVPCVQAFFSNPRTSAPTLPACISPSAISIPHSRNPYCTAVFRTVPRNQVFSAVYIFGPPAPFSPILLFKIRHPEKSFPPSTIPVLSRPLNFACALCKGLRRI